MGEISLCIFFLHTAFKHQTYHGHSINIKYLTATKKWNYGNIFYNELTIRWSKTSFSTRSGSWADLDSGVSE